jgi:hypothetical protein
MLLGKYFLPSWSRLNALLSHVSCMFRVTGTYSYSTFENTVSLVNRSKNSLKSFQASEIFQISRLADFSTFHNKYFLRFFLFLSQYYSMLVKCGDFMQNTMGALPLVHIFGMHRYIHVICICAYVICLHVQYM